MSVKCSEVVNFKITMGYHGLISQVFDQEIEYIHGYKSLIGDYFKKALALQVSSGSKLGKLPDEYEKANWLDSSPILKLTQQIPKIIQKQLESLKNFLDDIEGKLKAVEAYLKGKASEIKKYQQKYDETNNELIKKYIEVEKMKNSYLNSINKSENLIMKFYDNKKKIEEAKKGKVNLNDNELKLLNDKNKEYESQKKSQIKSTKKHEVEYKNVIQKSVKYEDKFISIVNDSIKGVKDVIGDISDKLRETIVDFLNSVRDSFKIPLDIIDSNIEYMKDLNEKQIITTAMEKTFNNECKLLHITPVRYSLKSLEITEEDSKKRNSKGSNSKNKKKNKNNINDENYLEEKGMVKFEDGFEEMSYFEDDMALFTVKEMFENFELINHNGLNIKIEEEKNEAKSYVNKLILNMSHETNKISNDFNIINEEDVTPFTNEEKNNLKSLLNKHHNRVIFLHKLNDYRTSSLFELSKNEYQILGELFSSLIDISKKEKDYHSVEMAIILSKTYYIMENNKKVYIQNLIQNNENFKEKSFWEELLIYSISKEVIRSKKRDGDNSEKEDILNEKNANIIFSQLLSLIDNMSDFGVDGEMIKQIIEPKLIYYKVDDKLKATINSVIESKMKVKKNDK